MKTNIIKQDINFLDKPLWFQNLRPEGLGFTWTDIEGYLYRSIYKPTDKVDILILFYLMLKSQMKGYSTKVETSRYEILKACGLTTEDPKYYERLEESLRRWKNVAIEFHGTFYDGRDYISIGFGILDSYRIDEKTKRVTVNLNPEWMLKIKESKFFKYINFEYYKALRRPVSRRLWELLGKTFKGRTEWSSHLTKLGAKLGIAKRKVITQEGEKEVLYASDVFTAIKPAINDINRLAKIPGIAEKLAILEEDLFTLTYKIEGKKQDRVVHFYKHLVKIPQKVEKKSSKAMPQVSVDKPEPEREIVSKQEIASKAIEPSTTLEVTKHKLADEGIFSPEIAAKNIHHQEKKDVARREEQLNTLFDQLKKKTQTLKEIIAKYYDEQGYEYVLWNIRYANANATKNYVVYLQKTLEKDWAREWREEREVEYHKKQNREEKVKAILKQIEEMGGKGKVLCRGKKIWGILECGLETGIKGLTAITPWDGIDAEDLTKAPDGIE